MDAICREILEARSEAWEFELAAQLLGTALEPAREFYARRGRALAGELPRVLGHEAAADYVLARLNVLGAWAGELKPAIEGDLARALGPTGKPGDPTQIESACARIALFPEHLVEWENDVARHCGAPHWAIVFGLLRGLTEPLAATVFQFADALAAVPPQAARGRKHFDLRYTLPAPRSS